MLLFSLLPVDSMSLDLFAIIALKYKNHVICMGNETCATINMHKTFYIGIVIVEFHIDISAYRYILPNPTALLCKFFVNKHL